MNTRNQRRFKVTCKNGCEFTLTRRKRTEILKKLDWQRFKCRDLSGSPRCAILLTAVELGDGAEEIRTARH